ncbi:elongation factor P maturation arginine rhamnosyltransferase EarP [Usitatibacter palustris]|uniref:Protein-arginine rhamnosyltransferase n=1 Tax=Usitatibacter palustris TaxID=2732487 RepID=A0A6M4HBJ0_9PROT|nr:elongation factor P maturation arginine rhamnosyltransferase EarP [Usitatibacter palustris]QJR15844.1 hypothetical protein DSM104440_02670 [Usitatibacter palustris]
MANAAERWDVFCKVVDNYGDVAVSWRLARLLAREHGKRVRLWLDRVDVLAKLRPELDAASYLQVLEGVEIARWRDDATDIAEVVVETFGCDPPEAYVLAMAASETKPRWINLEYLSAEDWVEGSHRLPSPNPRLPLVKHYFFPGFTPRTGGLLREHDLLTRRDAFQSSEDAQAQFWRDLRGEVPRPGALKVSVFAYPGAAIEALRAALGPDACLVVPGENVPFLPQDRYDELLWACDLNFVRGEDSFVRAQWAGRPFVWQIYPQDEGAHWVKLSAFLARFSAGLSRDDAAALTALWEAWNKGEGVGPAWAGFAGRRATVREASQAWAQRLAGQGELAFELAKFTSKLLK